MITRLPTYFLSHGGGPWPYMKSELGDACDKLETSIQSVRDELGIRPTAVLVISGHWECSEFTVSANARPPMLYDYYGFPAHTYEVRYEAPGAPALAARVQALLQAGGIDCLSDEDRGFDHGTFTVMDSMFPEADVPILQLSLRLGFDPMIHMHVGSLLAPLREEGVLILGSGLSYHNLRMMGPAAAEPSKQFDAWLQEVLVESSPSERQRKIVYWSAAPSARLAHPREDHLMPLMVVLGAANDDPATCIYHEEDFLGSLTVSSFRFGAA